MTADADMLRRLLAEAAANAAREAGADADTGRPDDADAANLDELVAYLRDELGADERARVERRLVASPAAARALLDLADLEAVAAAPGTTAPSRTAAPGPAAGPTPEPAAAPVAATEPAGAAWHDLLRRLRPRILPTWLPALAAASLLLCVGLGWRLAVVENRLQRAEDQLAAAGTPAPVVNLATLFLTAVRGDGATPTVSTVPGEPLHLAVSPERRCPVYRAEIFRAGTGTSAGGGPEDAEPVVSLPGLARDGRGSLNALVRLQAGDYTLRLYGCQPEELLRRQEFRVLGGGGGS